MAKKYIGAWQTLNIIDRMLKKEHKEYGVTAVSFALGRVKSYIQGLPAADVQEVKHGEWVRDEFDMLCCSECNEEPEFENITSYCPYCGAKMDGKDGKNENI